MGDRLLGWNGGVDFLHQLLIGLIANNSARINIYLIFRNKKKIIFFSKIILLFKLKKSVKFMLQIWIKRDIWCFFKIGIIE